MKEIERAQRCLALFGALHGVAFGYWLMSDEMPSGVYGPCEGYYKGDFALELLVFDALLLALSSLELCIMLVRASLWRRFIDVAGRIDPSVRDAVGAVFFRKFVSISRDAGMCLRCW